MGSPLIPAPPIQPSSSAPQRKGPGIPSARRGGEVGTDISHTWPTWSSRAQHQPMASKAMRVPRGFPAVPAGVGGQGFEPQSLSTVLPLPVHNPPNPCPPLPASQEALVVTANLRWEGDWGC